jgi:hypothetical protein
VRGLQRTADLNQAKYLYWMALDPEIVQQYVHAHEAYTAACSEYGRDDDPVVLETRERLRANLASYILDLEVNGMSVPSELTDQMAALGED